MHGYVFVAIVVVKCQLNYLRSSFCHVWEHFLKWVWVCMCVYTSWQSYLHPLWVRSHFRLDSSKITAPFPSTHPAHSHTHWQTCCFLSTLEHIDQDRAWTFYRFMREQRVTGQTAGTNTCTKVLPVSTLRPIMDKLIRLCKLLKSTYLQPTNHTHKCSK